jgi:hypothetical protein
MGRFLPEQLSVMMAEYLCIVRPLEVFFCEKFQCKGLSDVNEFIWADYRKGIWTGDFISDRLQLATSTHKMHGLGLQEYRQVATAFMEVHIKEVNNVQKDSTSLLDTQAGHSARTRQMEYARSTEDHRQVGRDTMHEYYLISNKWHELLLSTPPGSRMEIDNVGNEKVLNV